MKNIIKKILATTLAATSILTGAFAMSTVPANATPITKLSTLNDVQNLPKLDTRQMPPNKFMKVGSAHVNSPINLHLSKGNVVKVRFKSSNAYRPTYHPIRIISVKTVRVKGRTRYMYDAIYGRGIATATNRTRRISNIRFYEWSKYDRRIIARKDYLKALLGSKYYATGAYFRDQNYVYRITSISPSRNSVIVEATNTISQVRDNIMNPAPELAD